MVREDNTLRGQINWFEDWKLINYGLATEEELIWPEKEFLNNLRDKCVEHLKKEGFVFFHDTVEYRVKMNKNNRKLKEFGVQYREIK